MREEIIVFVSSHCHVWTTSALTFRLFNVLVSLIVRTTGTFDVCEARVVWSRLRHRCLGIQLFRVLIGLLLLKVALQVIDLLRMTRIIFRVGRIFIKDDRGSFDFFW